MAMFQKLSALIFKCYNLNLFLKFVEIKKIKMENKFHFITNAKVNADNL